MNAIVALAFTAGVAYVLVHYLNVDLAWDHKGVWIFLGMCFAFALGSASAGS